MEEQSQPKGRATTISELGTIVGHIFNRASLQHGRAFKPHASDIIISPYAKCGTTWLQHIVHGLRTQGNMDFEEINAVAPWIEMAFNVGWDLDAPQVAEPRVFKSHAAWHDVPKGARYIVSFRHSHDAIVSFYRFFEGWLFEPGTISLEGLIAWRWPRDAVDRKGYWYHLASWWEQRHNRNVLLLCYEDMKRDLPGTVQRIARFIGIPLNDGLLDIVVRQSSREFMLAHSHRFDERDIREFGEKRAGLPSSNNSHKVTPGVHQVTQYQLSPTIKEMLDDIWREQIAQRFGLETYDDLRQALAELNESK